MTIMRWALLTLLCVPAMPARAGTTVWGFNASFGNPHIQAYDLDTGAAIADFPAPHKDANRGRANGRGIAVVGNTILYTLADTPNVYLTDAVTHADLGIAFTTPLKPGINSLAWDGASLWLLSSQPGDDNVYQYSPTGTLLKTLVLARPANTNLPRDGFEVTRTGIVADRGSVPYDAYDLSGNLQKALLITDSARTTGIAFDGTNYIVSEVANGRLAIFNSAGTFLRSVVLTGAAIPFGLMDLAVDLAQVGASTPPAPQFAATGVVNAASYAGGPIAPGEIITIFGSGIGPAALAGLKLSASGLVDSSLAGTRVLFDGVPAPILFTSATQLSAVVPYSVAGKVSVQVETEYSSVRSAPVPVTVAASAPGIFTIDSSGKGQGAILNQDGSLNSAVNPAKKGSVVVLFATGEGQTNPGGVDGKLSVAPFPAPLLPATVTVNNAVAEVLYAGAAPTLVAGLLQVNIRLPADAPSGNLPVTLRIGNASSPAGVTVAVQ